MDHEKHAHESHGTGPEGRAQYRRAREAFDDLRVEDQAVFIVEAAVGVLARGVEQAGHAVADALDDLLRTRPRRPDEPTAPPPPEPPPPPVAPEPPFDPETI